MALLVQPKRVEGPGREIAGHSTDDLEALNILIKEFCPRAKQTAADMADIIMRELRKAYAFSEAEVNEHYGRILDSLVLARMTDTSRRKLDQFRQV